MLGNIKRLCDERGISISQLEREAGIAERTIYRWDENTPSVDKVKRVADYFGCAIDELLRNDVEAKADE